MSCVKIDEHNIVANDHDTTEDFSKTALHDITGRTGIDIASSLDEDSKVKMGKLSAGLMSRCWP